MKLLLICPDYISHYLPMSAVAAAGRCRGATVVVATGSLLRERVERDGFQWRHLAMSRGGNPGLLSERERPVADADDLSAFFDATRLGMVATLRHQALARADDLLWEPAYVADQVGALVAVEQPDAILADHLSFAATLALRAGGHAFTTFVPGHPAQLPCGGEVYGSPTTWPRSFAIEHDELCRGRSALSGGHTIVHHRYNEVSAALAPDVDPVADAFAVRGHDVLFNSPHRLRDVRRDPWLGRHAFLGSCVRKASADDRTDSWITRSCDTGGFIYVSFGTFLSERVDVLRRVVDALTESGVRVAMATGTADLDALGDIPRSWLVAPSLPQISLLERATAVVTHGGNNTVTESLTAGCTMLVLPFSTDQFAIAADLERAGVGIALDPNRASIDDIAAGIRSVVTPEARATAHEFAESLRRRSGPALAVDRLVGRGVTSWAAGSAPDEEVRRCAGFGRQRAPSPLGRASHRSTTAAEQLAQFGGRGTDVRHKCPRHVRVVDEPCADCDVAEVRVAVDEPSEYVVQFQVRSVLRHRDAGHRAEHPSQVERRVVHLGGDVDEADPVVRVEVLAHVGDEPAALAAALATRRTTEARMRPRDAGAEQVVRPLLHLEVVDGAALERCDQQMVGGSEVGPDDERPASLRDLGESRGSVVGIDLDRGATVDPVLEVGDLGDLADAAEVSGGAVDDVLLAVRAAMERTEARQGDAEASCCTRVDSRSPSHTGSWTRRSRALPIATSRTSLRADDGSRAQRLHRCLLPPVPPPSV